MSDFDLYILKKYLFIPLQVLCIPVLWGPALQWRKFEEESQFAEDREGGGREAES